MIIKVTVNDISLRQTLNVEILDEDEPHVYERDTDMYSGVCIGNGEGYTESGYEKGDGYSDTCYPYSIGNKL